MDRGWGGGGVGQRGKGWPSPDPYLRRNFLTAGLVFKPILGLRVVEGRLGLGVSACG